ncbi:MAG TPA: transcriptional regulator [Euryarchaeota archaeon]|nr:hypothetical protein BMS3Bbin16_00874 [archaeon BMS3Bbin16]HDH27518.1 transcriptional regulator [Euryarchaeota archaeon]
MPIGITEAVISVAIVLLVLYAFYKVMKILVYNTVAGLVILFLLNLTVFASRPIDITIAKVVFTAIAGVFGAALIAGLHYLSLFGV